MATEVEPESLLGDKGYDADSFEVRAIEAVTPPRSSRKANLVERFFNAIKHKRHRNTLRKDRPQLPGRTAPGLRNPWLKWRQALIYYQNFHDLGGAKATGGAKPRAASDTSFSDASDTSFSDAGRSVAMRVSLVRSFCVFDGWAHFRLGAGGGNQVDPWSCPCLPEVQTVADLNIVKGTGVTIRRTRPASKKTIAQAAASRYLLILLPSDPGQRDQLADMAAHNWCL